MYSLLQKKPKIQLEPYPHVVIEDALPWDLYEALENTFPEDLILGTQPYDNGICYRMKADMLLKKDLPVPTVWREFTEYHTSAQWFNEVNELFKDHMPTVLNKTFTENDLGARGWADKDKNIWTDCQVVMHKPIVEILVNLQEESQILKSTLSKAEIDGTDPSQVEILKSRINHLETQDSMLKDWEFKFWNNIMGDFSI